EFRRHGAVLSDYRPGPDGARAVSLNWHVGWALIIPSHVENLVIQPRMTLSAAGAGRSLVLSRAGETILIGRCSMIGRKPFIVAMIADPLLSSVAPIGPSKPMPAKTRAIVLGIEMIFQFCWINETVSRPMSIASGTFQSPPCKSTTGAVSLAASVPPSTAMPTSA